MNANKTYFSVTTITASGSSGGPVFDLKTKQVIGMVSRETTPLQVNPDEPETPTNVDPFRTGDAGFAYRIDVILEQLRRWGYRL